MEVHILNMDTEQKRCQNCQCILPEGNAGKLCETCRAAKTERRKKTLMDLLLAPGILAMSIATRGNRHYHQKNTGSDSDQ